MEGNVFTSGCQFVQEGGVLGLCMMSLSVYLPGPMFLWGVSVPGLMFYHAGHCLGVLSRVTVWIVSVRLNPPEPYIPLARTTSYCNVFFF